ncbi:SH3 domain-containing protein [Oceaniglobus indicus]|uniref:SH3 domain-containing protein n=1 Tax=Oceaniglobus indicus TaxID=2047749 RepID=UPI000C173E15|nr:SH3 domain-containing protein [Oceaniglobus indicus]
MIRLTLLLIAGLAVTMYAFGQNPDLPQGSDPGGPPEVTRTNSDDSGLLTRVGNLIDEATAAEQPGEHLPLASEQKAIEIALAATVSPDAPAAAPPRTVNLGGTTRTTTAPTSPENDLWIVTGSRVNLRAGPSTSDSVVGSVREGQRAEMLEETANGWYRIRTADDGQSGFIFGRFLSPLDAG